MHRVHYEHQDSVVHTSSLLTFARVCGDIVCREPGCFASGAGLVVVLLVGRRRQKSVQSCAEDERATQSRIETEPRNRLTGAIPPKMVKERPGLVSTRRYDAFRAVRNLKAGKQ